MNHFYRTENRKKHLRRRRRINEEVRSRDDDAIEVQYAGWYRSNKTGHNKLVRINN